MWSRLEMDSFSIFVKVRNMHQVGLGIMDTDGYIFIVEDLADLIADRIIDALNVELG